MIKNFLVISCTGKNDKLGLKIDNNFFIHELQTNINKNDNLVDIILNFLKKNEVKLNRKIFV